MARPIWTAAAELGEALRETPQMQSFRRAFDDDEFRARLSQLTAIYTPLREHELLLGARLNQAGAVVEEWLESDEDHKWVESAVDSGTGFQVVIEYLRSYLPRYPYLRVPHLRRGSPLDFADGPFFIDYFPRQREIRNLRFEPDSPPNLSGLGGNKDFTELLIELAAALKERESWRRFAAARYAMSDDDWNALIQLSAGFAERVTDDVVDAKAGDLLLDRFTYRMSELEQAVARAEGAVREYLAAFEAVHKLITFLAGFLETVITKGYLPSISPYRMDIGPGHDHRQVELATFGDDPFHRGGGVFFVKGPDEATQGLLYARGHNHRWPRPDEPERSTMVVEGWFCHAPASLFEERLPETE